MIELKLDTLSLEGDLDQTIPVSFHASFYLAYKKLKRWVRRFPLSFGDSIVNDLILFYSLAKKKYLDHRSAPHLLRLVLSIYQMQRKLLSSSILSSHARHLTIRWMPTNLLFLFSSKPVLGCLIGFNVMDRCELFDEENVAVALQKYFPELQLVKDCHYRHNSQHENLKLFYCEIEKKNGTSFSLEERKALKVGLEEKIKNGIQKLVPSVFMKLNQEEIYKNILILSQEISSIQDIPQVYITLDQHSGKEVVFHVSLVQISPFHRFSFKDRLLGCSFVLERSLPVRSLEGHQVEACLFRLFLPFDTSFLRSNGSLDFYAARQKAVSILEAAIGEFRDYNGGLLIKQQELLFSFKQNLPEEESLDAELMETFFHALVPLEKQALLAPKILSSLYTFFLDHRKEKIGDVLSFKMHRDQQKLFISARGNDPSISDAVTVVLRGHLLSGKDWAYNLLETAEGTFFNCVLLNEPTERESSFLQALQDSLYQWDQQRKSKQNLRIALGHSIFSLDPRVGGDVVSSNILHFLFEGLTRFDQDGHIENAVAESIEISPDLKRYTFKLRSCFWNDGSIVSAYDFVYSWGKILSPDFKTSFASLFYPIKNAREAKEGKVSIEELGVYALNDRTLQVDLVHPTPYFLQMTARSIFSPVHRFMDQECPQWPYQIGKQYPCNGPFQLKLNQPNRGYQLIKNPMYWDASQIRLDQIALTPMDPPQASRAFIRKEIDWVGNPFGGWHSSFHIPEEHGRVLAISDVFVSWFVFNTNAPPFHHRKIREAFALGIDRSELVVGASPELTPAYSILTSSYSANRSPFFPQCNVEKALQLLDEGLEELGMKKQDLCIQLAFAQIGVQEITALALKKQLKERLGIECQLQAHSWDAFFQKMTEGKFQVGLMQWTTVVDDPIYTLNAFKFSREGVNFSKWENREFQSLLNLSEEETNPFQRSMYLVQAETVLSQEAPVIPLFYRHSQAVIRNDFYIHSQHNPRGFFNVARGFYTRR